jgi:hypothetical protein
MLAVLICAILGQDPTRAGIGDVSQLIVSAPRALTEIDTGKIPGAPARLAWGPNGVLYVRVTELDRWGNERNRHFLVTPSEKAVLTPADGEPLWLAAYWAWKSAPIAPGLPTVKLEIEQRRERNRIINAPSGGGLAGTASAALPGSTGGEGVSQGVAAAAANSGYTASVVTVRFKGQVVAEWADEAPQPGMRLGWAPAPMGLLAYVDTENRLTLTDREGRKLRVPGTTSVLLPAWSPDGKQIAFLQKNKKKYAVMLVDVGR